MASVNAFKVRAIIEAGYDKSSLNRANKDIAQSYSQLQGKLTAITRASSVTQQSAAMIGAGYVAAFGASIAAAAAFEEQFVNVKKTLNVAGDAKQAEKAFDNISKRLRDMVKLAPITTQAINEIAAIGGQLGVAASEIVTFTDTIQKLTIATNLGADQAALSMARLQEITGTTGTELDNLASSLVALGNNFAATESEIVTAALQIATATAQIGGEMNQTAVDALAFSTTLKAIGQPSQAGATAIVRLMTELSEAIAMGGANLELFAKVAGMSTASFKDLFDIDSTKAVALFIDGLNDTERLGMTNIGVLQKLGLGQVRTQKAILATAKASDTLFEAIDVANDAFIENNALNEEAERRYATLVSEITKGRNVIKGEILDFGLENIETGTNIVRQFNNAIFALVKAFTAGLNMSFRFFGGITVLIAGIRAYRTTLFAVREELGMYNLNAAAAIANTKRFNTALQEGSLRGPAARGMPRTIFEDERFGSKEFQQELSEGGFYGRGIKGGISFNPFRAGRTAELRKAITDNPALLETIYGGQVPQSMRFMLGGAGVTQTKFGSSEMASIGTLQTGFLRDTRATRKLRNKSIFNQLQNPTTFAGALRAKASVRRNQRLIDSLLSKRGGLANITEDSMIFSGLGSKKVDKALLDDVARLKRLRTINKRRIVELNGLIKDLRPFGRGGRTSGINVLRAELAKTADIGIDFQRAMSTEGRGGVRGFFDRKRLEKSMPIIARNSKVFQENLQKSVEALQAGDIKGGQLALAMQDVEAKTGRISNTLKGMAKGFGRIAGMALALTVAFKFVEKIGEASRGVMQFTNSMREMSDATRELADTTDKLANARELLAANSGDAQIADLLTKEIEQLEKAVETSRVNTATDVGVSFLENIMNASFGSARGTRSRGSMMEGFIKQYGSFIQDEQGITDAYGRAIGDLIVSLTNPENIKASGGQLPTGNEVLEALLFSEGGFGEEIQIPSGFFQGASQRVISQLIEDSGAMTGEEFVKFLGIDTDKLDSGRIGEITSELNQALKRFIKGGVSATDFMFSGDMALITARVSKLTEELDLTEKELADTVAGVTAFLIAAGGIAGVTADSIEGFRQLDENSPLAVSIKRFLKARLEDFESAGTITNKELQNAGDNYSKLLNLYVSANEKFIAENKKSVDALMDEFGVTEMAALRLAIRIEDAFKKARAAMVDFTKPLPDNQFDDMTLLEMISQTQAKALAQAEFEQAIQELRKSNPLLADQLAQMGVMGGGLELVRRFASSPGLATAQEQALAAAVGPDYLQEIFGTTDPGLSEVEQLGENIVDGIAKGFANKEGALANALVDTMKHVVDKTVEYIRSQSPSQLTMEKIGIPMIDGIAAPFFFMKDEVADAYVGVVKNAVEKAAEEVPGMQNFIDLLIGAGGSKKDVDFALTALGAGTDPKGVVRSFQEMVANGRTAAVGKLKEAFNLTTAITNAERQQVINAQNLAQAKFDYVNLLNSEASIQRQLDETSRKRIQMEKDGIAGNITLSERANLLRQEISIEDRKRRLRGDFTASEQLSINEQVKKVGELQRMFDLGVVSALELEAEQDRLRDMRGGFKTEAEKELFFVESALAEEQFREAERVALLEDEQLQQLRDAEASLLFQLETFGNQKEIAFGKVEQAAEQVAGGIIDLEQAQQNYKEKAPEFLNELEVLDDHFSGVNDSVRALLDATNKFGEVDSDKIVTTLTPVVNILSQINAARQLAEDFAFGTRDDVGPQNPDLPISTGGVGGLGMKLGYKLTEDFVRDMMLMFQSNKFGPVPQGMMGMRTKGYQYGGRGDTMRRALVGEYGPEEVRFVPGSGFLVKPLTQGGRGTNTIVENLNVNVTGVPADPTSARKAAVQIRTALNRLDREGIAGGGLTRR